jgi:hypothetical protein
MSMRNAGRWVGITVLVAVGIGCHSEGFSGSGGTAPADTAVPAQGDGGAPTAPDALSAQDGPAMAQVEVAVTSVRGGAVPRDLVEPPTFSRPTNFGPGWINSGPPEHATLTLTRIALVRQDSSTSVLWEGEAALRLDGTPVDVSAINAAAQPVAPGPITAVHTTVKTVAQMKGVFTGTFNTATNAFVPATKTYYTKADAAYNVATSQGGAADATHFETGPAEEVDVWLGGNPTELDIETPSSTVIQAGAPTRLTLLFDTSRLLRFYNGLSPQSGPNPADPADRAYFFAHSLGGTFAAAFFGDPGRIEGYRTVYSCAREDGNGEGVTGWMTIIFDASGGFLSGLLMGDDDNALTVAKGRISSFTGTPIGDAGVAGDDAGVADDDAGAGGGDAGVGSSDASSAAVGPPYTFVYDIATATVSGFVPATAASHYTPLATFSAQSGTRTGEAYFQLQLKTP